MKRQEMINYLADIDEDGFVHGKALMVTSDWLKQNDEQIHEWIRIKLQSFVRDERNTADQENLDLFDEGEYLIELTFNERGCRYSAGETQQILNNQPSWGEDTWEDWSDDKIELYYKNSTNS